MSENEKPRFRYRYAPSNWGDNAVQDTPRTFAEETGTDTGSIYYETRPEDKDYKGGGKRQYSPHYAWLLKERAKRKRKWVRIPSIRKEKRFAISQRRGFKKYRGKKYMIQPYRKIKFKKPEEKPYKIKTTYTVISPAEQSAQERRIRKL